MYGSLRPRTRADAYQPIRTPGAVQGYGILVAVEEDEQTGDLVVRQVSEVRVVRCLSLLPAHRSLELDRVTRALSAVPLFVGVLHTNSS